MPVINWSLSLSITRFDDGYSLDVSLPDSDRILIHRATKDEIINIIQNNLSTKIDEIESRKNPS